MSAMALEITILTIVYSTVYSGADQRKHQSSASLAFVGGIRRWPLNSPHKGQVSSENVSIWWRQNVTPVSGKKRHLSPPLAGVRGGKQKRSDKYCSLQPPLKNKMNTITLTST